MKINKGVDILSKEECQAIIDYDHDWTVVEAPLKLGGKVKFKQAPFVLWADQYPTMLKECVIKYEVGDYLSLHVDNGWWKVKPGYHASVVWITPLSDDYEGGELYVEGNLVEQVVGVPHKMSRTTLHEITEVTKGVRYSLVSWSFVKGEE